jgi:hypothetical protein
VGGIGTGVRRVDIVPTVDDVVITIIELTATLVDGAVRTVVTFGAVTLAGATRVTFVAATAAVPVKSITLPAASAHKTFLILGSLVPWLVENLIDARHRMKRPNPPSRQKWPADGGNRTDRYRAHRSAGQFDPPNPGDHRLAAPHLGAALAHQPPLH